MSASMHKTPKEQIIYANLLFYGSWGSLALMAATYLVYVSGLLAPHVPLDKIIVLWEKNAHDYIVQGNVPVGWGWTALLGTGDFLNFLGLALLAGMTIICFIPLVPAYLKEKRPVYAIIAVLEILVLAFAASGIVGAGAH